MKIIVCSIILLFIVYCCDVIYFRSSFAISESVVLDQECVLLAGRTHTTPAVFDVGYFQRTYHSTAVLSYGGHRGHYTLCLLTSLSCY